MCVLVEFKTEISSKGDVSHEGKHSIETRGILGKNTTRILKEHLIEDHKRINHSIEKPDERNRAEISALPILHHNSPRSQDLRSQRSI